jgi:hypothetical protein
MKRHIILFAVFIVACQQPPVLTAEEKKILADTIRHTLHNYHSDILAHGLTAEFKYLDSSADFFWVPPGFSASISYDSVAAVLKQNAPLFKSIDNSFDTLTIIPLSKELSSYTARIRSAMTDTAGQTSVVSLLETGILIRRKDGWKLLSGQTSINEIAATEKVCIASVIEEDERIGKIRNHACEKISLSKTIDDYVEGLSKIDYTGCPEKFSAAFKKHSQAWLNTKAVTDKYSAMRGEMHDLFKQLESGKDSVEFKRLQRAIWDTWGEVEAAGK